MNDPANKNSIAIQRQKVGRVVAIAGIVLGATTVFSAIPAAKWFFQTQLAEGFTVFDPLLIIGAVVAITGAAIYTHNKSQSNCITAKPPQEDSNAPTIHTVLAVSQGVGMGLAFQLTMIMVGYYGAGAGISGVGAVGLGAAASLLVSVVCAFTKNYMLYDDQTQDESASKRMSFLEWMDSKPGRFKNAIFFDCLLPCLLSSAVSGFAGYLLPKATTASVGVIALESILVGAAVLAIYSALQISKQGPGGSAEEGVRRV